MLSDVKIMVFIYSFIQVYKNKRSLNDCKFYLFINKMCRNISIILREIKIGLIMDAKTKAIVAHLTFIGWIIALVINSSQKEELASYYIRQTLGLYLVAIVLGWIPIIGWILWIVVLIFWVLSLVGAVNGEMKETPVVGKLFQDWFKSL